MIMKSIAIENWSKNDYDCLAHDSVTTIDDKDHIDMYL